MECFYNQSISTEFSREGPLSDKSIKNKNEIINTVCGLMQALGCFIGFLIFKKWCEKHIENENN